MVKLRISREFDAVPSLIVKGFTTDVLNRPEASDKNINNFIRFIAAHLRDTTWRDGKQANIDHFIDHASVKIGIKARARCCARLLFDQAVMQGRDEVWGGGSVLRAIQIYAENSYDNIEEYAFELKNAFINELKARGNGNLHAGLRNLDQNIRKELGIDEEFVKNAGSGKKFRKNLEEKLGGVLWSVLHRSDSGFAYGKVDKEDQMKQLMFLAENGLASDSNFQMNNNPPSLHLAPEYMKEIYETTGKFVNSEMNYSYNYYDGLSHERNAEICVKDLISYVKDVVKTNGLQSLKENNEKILLKIKDFSGVISEESASLIPQYLEKEMENDEEIKKLGVKIKDVHLHLHSQGRQNNKGYPAHTDFIFSSIKSGFSFSVDTCVAQFSDYFSHPNAIKMIKAVTERFFGISKINRDEFNEIFFNDPVIKIMKDYEKDAEKACAHAVSKSKLTPQKMEELTENKYLFGIAGGGKMNFILRIELEAFATIKGLISFKNKKINEWNNLSENEKSKLLPSEVDRLKPKDIEYQQVKFWEKLPGDNYDEKFQSFCNDIAFRISSPAHKLAGSDGLVTPGSFYHSQFVAALALNVFNNIDKFDDYKHMDDEELALKSMKLMDFNNFPIIDRKQDPEKDANYVNVKTGKFGELPGVVHKIDERAEKVAAAFRINKAYRYLKFNDTFGKYPENTLNLEFGKKDKVGKVIEVINFDNFGSVYDAIIDGIITPEKMRDYIAETHARLQNYASTQTKFGPLNLEKLNDYLIETKVKDIPSRDGVAKAEITEFVREGVLPESALEDRKIYLLALTNNEPLSPFYFQKLIANFGEKPEKVAAFNTSIISRVIEEIGDPRLLDSIRENVIKFKNSKDNKAFADAALKNMREIVKKIDDKLIKKIYGEDISKEFLRDSKDCIREHLVKLACAYKHMDIRGGLTEQVCYKMGGRTRVDEAA